MKKNDKERLRILYFVNLFSPLTQTFVYDEVLGMEKIADVLVVCTERVNEAAFPFDAVQQISTKNKFTERLRQGLFKRNLLLSYRSYSFQKQFKKIIQSFQPDLIHCHFGLAALKLVDNVKLTIPLVITFHGFDASRYLKIYPLYVKRLKKLFAQPFIYPLFVSRALQKNVRNYAISSSRDTVIYNGIDVHFFKRKQYTSDRIIFLQVSRLTEKKGVTYTIDAFQKFIVQNPHLSAQLIIAGDGILKTALEEKVASMKLSDHVEFTGAVNKDKVKQLMEKASVYVQHSVTASNGDTEGLPMVLMEAMAMELPILSTYHSGIPELIEDGIHGFLVQERDVDTYSEKMKVLSTWGYRKKNREKISTQFSLDAHVKNLMEFYRSIL